jgi:DNA-binding XRE family transcriptional regulator
MKEVPYSKLCIAIRKHIGYSQTKMAKTLNMSRSSYLKLEKGHKKLYLEDSKIVCDLVGITLEQLLEGKEVKTETLITLTK